jgi:hypothetical protein
MSTSPALKARAAVGTASGIGSADVPATGIEATGGVGTVTIIEGAGIDVPVTAPALVGGVGTAAVIGTSTLTLTGVAGTGSPGEVTVTTFQRIPVQVPDMFATGQVGTITANGTMRSWQLTGVASSASVGSVLVYGNIIPAPGTSWSAVTPSPGSSWSEEVPAPGQTWTEIAA